MFNINIHNSAIITAYEYVTAGLSWETLPVPGIHIKIVHASLPQSALCFIVATTHKDSGAAKLSPALQVVPVRRDTLRDCWALRRLKLHIERNHVSAWCHLASDGADKWQAVARNATGQVKPSLFVMARITPTVSKGLEVSLDSALPGWEEEKK